MKVTIKDMEIDNKNVIIRVDYNVPIKNGEILDDTRIIKSLETVNYALKRANKVILLSHLGRIKEESDFLNNSLYPVSLRLSELLNKEVCFIDDFDNAKNIIDNSEKKLFLVENTRFFDYPDKKESKCSEDLSKYFASLGDIFINDAFGTIHRAHASNYGISNYLPSAIGFLVSEELENLSKLDSPEHPYYVIMGGAKVNDKIGIISKLCNKCDKIFIGGGMSFTFLKALNYNVGNSIIDEDSIDFCVEVLNKYKEKIILPIDYRCNDSFNDEAYKEYDFDCIPSNMMGLDIGSKTIEMYKNSLSGAKTIMWNGPLGVYEFSNYQDGTKEILNYISCLDAFKVLGGGDIVACYNSLGDNLNIDYVSTGGGATLEYIEGVELPGIKNIKEDV